MAKTESTAVNELINLVQGGPTPQQEPSADLFAEPKSTRVSPPRMTSTIPPMRGAGEVAPLPRGRAPQSTSQHTFDPQPPPVRMKTASPSRGTTIPPLARAKTPPPVRTTQASPIPNAPTTHSSPTLPSPRVTRPSLPPPKPSYPTLPTPKTSTSSMPALRNTPRATLPPSSMPTASPFEADANPFAAEPQAYPIVKRPSVDMTADVIRGDNWFDVSSKVQKLHEETWVGSTERSRKRELARMLVVPAIVAASVGVAIGVYISYRGHKTTPSTPSTMPSLTASVPAPAPSKEIQMPVTSTAPDPNSESANAATASAGGGEVQPPTKAEDAAKQQEAAALAAAHADDPAAEPTLTHDAPVNGNPQPALATTTTTAVTPAPAVQEFKTAHGVIKLVDVRIDSKPSGATVMIVDNGKTSFLGTTPLATSVDASHAYDVILTLEGRPTQMAHLDPTTASRLDISLPRAHHDAKPAAAALADVVEKPATTKAATKTDTKAATKTDSKAATKTDAKSATKTDAKKAATTEAFDPAAELASLGEAPKKEKAVAKTDAGGEGTLMVSSKPPCDIFIDGKATGLTTPQRSIALSAGTHKITFMNSAENIKKTVSVQISADKPTKLIQDLMAK